MILISPVRILERQSVLTIKILKWHIFVNLGQFEEEVALSKIQILEVFGV